MSAGLMLEHMSDLPPDLSRLRTLQTYLQLQLADVAAAIEAAERGGGGVEQPGAPAGSAPAGDGELRWWRLVPGRPGHPGGTLHRGDCAQPGGALLSLVEARLALDEEGVRPCSRCNPQDRVRRAG
jgi:Family of unknown function (DUF6233)